MLDTYVSFPYPQLIVKVMSIENHPAVWRERRLWHCKNPKELCLPKKAMAIFSKGSRYRIEEMGIAR